MLSIGVGVGLGFETVGGSSLSPPSIQVAPVISGTALVNQTLSTTNGTWSNSPTSFTYQWKRNGSNISSATNSTYVLVNADDGASITCAVTASNAAGNSSPSTSNSLVVFDPSSLANLALWIDPADTTTMFQSNAGTTTVTDGSVCGFAGDKSGAAFNLTSVADDTTRLTWNNNSGLPYLTAVAASSQMLRRTASLGLYAAGACSMFIALRGNPTTSKNIISERSTATTNPSYVLGSDSTTATSDNFFVRNDAGTITSSQVISTGAFDNNDRVVGLTDDGANLAGYVDGSAVGTGTYTRSGTLTVNSFALFASLTTTATNFFECPRMYGLVIVKRVVTAQERANITTYLGAKQGRSL